MSGHSRWSNIKRTKEKSDAKKGKIFTKIGREITVAVRSGGADASANSKLKELLAKARQNNMPSENVSRLIKKASGNLDQVSFEEITYEGYGIGGSAVIVESLTDNKNRTAGDVRHAFDKCGGSLGTTGCVSYFFEKQGVIIAHKNGDDDEILMQALECGADDVEIFDEVVSITTSPENFSKVLESCSSVFKIISSQIEMVAGSTVELSEEQKQKFERMIDMLEDNDDVQNVWHNVDLD